jgi:beta-glucosidase
VTVTADPRLLARFDAQAARWHITQGSHQIAVGKAADNLVLTAEAVLSERLFGT